VGETLENLYRPAAVGSAVAGGYLNSVGARAQGRAIKAAAGYDSQQALYESRERASRLRTVGRREIGRQRAVLGASGIRVAGSPLELIAQNAAELERQAMEETLAGRYASDVALARGKTGRKQAKRISAASLFEGGTKALYYGRETPSSRYAADTYGLGY
jgi:hypothetical protein